MIRKSVQRFSEKIMPIKKLKRDDRALGNAPFSIHFRKRARFGLRQ